MRRAADDQKRGDGSNGQAEDPVRDIECPATIRIQGSEEILLFDESPRADSKFHIGGATPNGGDNSKDWRRWVSYAVEVTSQGTYL